MAKSKKEDKKKDDGIQFLRDYDNMMNKSYDNLLEEIQDMQIIIASEDAKIQKRAKKAAKKGKGYYNINKERRKVREHILGQMEETSWFDRIVKILSDIAPIVVIIARLVAALILSILSVDEVKVNISKELLGKLNTIYSKCMVLS